MTRGRAIRLAIIAALMAIVLTVAVVIGWGVLIVHALNKGRAEREAAVLAGMDAATVAPPTGRCVVFPKFGFSDGTSVLFGRGFFVRSRDMSAVGVTSLHFLNLSGPGLILVEWFDDPRSIPIGSAERTFAPPGQQPDGLHIRLADDYLLLAPDRPLSNITFLELDDRAGPLFAEPVWFPVADKSADNGFRWTRGAVRFTHNHRIDVQLKEANVSLFEASGTPVISGTTGRVIGLVSSGRSSAEQTDLFLAPIHAVREALNKPADKKRLAEINWPTHRAQEKAGP